MLFFFSHHILILFHNTITGQGKSKKRMVISTKDYLGKITYINIVAGVYGPSISQYYEKSVVSFSIFRSKIQGKLDHNNSYALAHSAGKSGFLP